MSIEIPNNPDLLDQVLGCGLYQIFHSIVYQWIIVIMSSNIIMMAFLKKQPHSWICAVWKTNQSSSIDFSTTSLVMYSSEICNSRDNGTDFCAFWQPSETMDFYSIVPEVVYLDLCGSNLMPPIFFKLFIWYCSFNWFVNDQNCCFWRFLFKWLEFLSGAQLEAN